MAVETAGRDPKFALNDVATMTLMVSGEPRIFQGLIVKVFHGTAAQLKLVSRRSKARNAGELQPRFFYRVRGQGFDPDQWYREETLDVPEEF